MLVHAASRRSPQKALRAYQLHPDQVLVPCLYPSLLPSRAQRGRPLAIDHGPQNSTPLRRRNERERTRAASRRLLATAVDFRPSGVPFDFNQTLGVPGSSLSRLRPFDPSAPLLIPEPTSESMTDSQRYRIINGVGGDVTEILTTLDACLFVGRLDRAALILRRLRKLGTLSAETTLDIHNRYIQASVEKLLSKYSAPAAQSLHKWFELEIRSKHVAPNAKTLAWMLKASLLTPIESKKKRLVWRYMDMAPGDAGLEVLHMADILSAQELNEITHIATTYNITPDVDDFEEDGALEEEVEATTVDAPEPKSEPRDVYVKPTHFKGLGLKSLQQALSLFSEKPADFDPGKLDAEAQRDRQIRIEENAVQAAMDRWRAESEHLIKMGYNTALQTKSVGARMWQWHADLTTYIREEMIKIDEAESKTLRSRADTDRCNYGPYLRYLDPEKLAAVAILSFMTIASTAGVKRGVPLTAAVLHIGESVQDESFAEVYHAERQKRRREQPKVAWQDWDEKTKLENRQQLIAWLKKVRESAGAVAPSAAAPGSSAEANANASDEVPHSKLKWPRSVKAKVGAVLMSALIEVAKVPVRMEHADTKELVTQIQPAFSHANQFRVGRRIGVIFVNHALATHLGREPVHSLLAKHLPMVAEPKSWAGFTKGGFLSYENKFMRTKTGGEKDQRLYIEAATEKGDMDQTFKGLDVLSKTPWTINKPVFRAMVEAWNTGEAIANIPAENPEVKLPPEPSRATDPQERRKWIRAIKESENQRCGLHSQRCFQNFQLEVARALEDEIFYFPHNVDFRGRAYPIPPLLNHMGADHCRGLLRFAKGRELGANGLKWLKVHLANVYGFDKASLQGREDFATEHLPDILDSANNPLKGSRWWLEAEDPWQCLAVCIELRDALASPDPTRFVSHLPVHQDGTCNGLQHYAALGGDEWGARQVNLEPGDRPADVYTAVAELVKESLAKDLEQGNPLARYLDGKITRKVVKQTVMTNVYGVTYSGAKAQVRKQLVAAHNDIPNEPVINVEVLASYITTKIFTALSTMFKGAHDIQYWLGNCAGRIAESLTPQQINRVHQKSKQKKRTAPVSGRAVDKKTATEEATTFRSSVVWTTPLRMPVVQPYRSSSSRVIQTNLQAISITDPHRNDPVSKRKQVQGFPPNFVHSLDATHMLLSAIRCHELGLSFAAVHDSFWTHAGSVEVMNGVLRDAFIQIHSEDVIKRLAAEFQARYKDHIYLASVNVQSPAGKEIVAWRKANGTSKVQELLLEHKRLQLLASSDPNEVAEGKEIITPGSIADKLPIEVESEDLEGMGIGEIGTAVGGVENEAAENILAGVDSVDAAIKESDDPIVCDPETTNDELSNSHDDSSQGRQPTPFERAANVNLAKRVPPRQKKQTVTWAWLPLSFPPVPQKVCVALSTRGEDFFAYFLNRARLMYLGSKTANTSSRE